MIAIEHDGGAICTSYGWPPVIMIGNEYWYTFTTKEH